MPRANRYYLPGYVWHITHRCHKQEFLLKFAKDRRRWKYWLYEAKQRFGLRVLNYVVTSNHIHLLVHDRGEGEIAKSMQLVAGRTAQEYNQRKSRKGAYWEDRYHATVVDTDTYLGRCMTYIDLNMVRAGVVIHPVEWDTCGYREIQSPPRRYAIIDQNALLSVFGFKTSDALRESCRRWVEGALRNDFNQREGIWTESLAVGRSTFIDDVRDSLGIKARHRSIADYDHSYVLREPLGIYRHHLSAEKADVSGKNTVIWSDN